VFLRSGNLGDAVSAPYRVRIRRETYREPDVTVYLAAHLDRFGERYGELPDLVVEVVSEDSTSHTRDYEDKRRDYADAGIPEYWIVDPIEKRVTVLVLSGGEFVVHGEYIAGQSAQSDLLVGFSVEATDIFDAAVA